MKKRVISLWMVVAILCIMFSGCAVSADTVSSTINVNERYYEEVIEVTSSVMEVPFTVNFSGYYIIQVFGATSSNTDPVFNGSVYGMDVCFNNYCIASSDVMPYTGYGRGRLVFCELSALDTYELWLSLSRSSGALRVSFTYARDLFYDFPLANYEDIYTGGPDVFEFTFDVYNEEYAQVARVMCGSLEAGIYNITVSGGGFEEVYVLDPSTIVSYTGVHILDGETRQMELEANIPYYIVVYLGDGDDPYIPVETITITVTFERVS